jgi:hypothetical protein
VVKISFPSFWNRLLPEGSNCLPNDLFTFFGALKIIWQELLVSHALVVLVLTYTQNTCHSFLYFGAYTLVMFTSKSTRSRWYALYLARSLASFQVMLMELLALLPAIYLRHVRLGKASLRLLLDLEAYSCFLEYDNYLVVLENFQNGRQRLKHCHFRQPQGDGIKECDSRLSDVI